jgi:hypothetical protein
MMIPPPLILSEVVKKFGHWQREKRRHVRGRDKFMTPKKALVSSWTPGDGTHWSRRENLSIFQE